MPHYIIEETARYAVEADSEDEAEEVFLDSIAVIGGRVETLDVPERAVYLDDEQPAEDE